MNNTCKKKDLQSMFRNDLSKEEQNLCMDYTKLAEIRDAKNNGFTLYKKQNHEGADSYKKLKAGSIDNLSLIHI